MTRFAALSTLSRPRTLNQNQSRGLRSWVAAIAVGALAAGGLVVAGVGAEHARANAFAPNITVTPGGEKRAILAGEDLTVAVSVTNPDGGKQFNLGLTALVPADLVLVNGGNFGTPKIFTAGEVLPNTTRTNSADCADLGLIPASSLIPAGPANRCAVPEGAQYWVFSNVNDLPQGATVSADIVVRPDTTKYPVGSQIEMNLNAWTSDDPTRLPVFDGSPSRSTSTAHTSARGTDDDARPARVQALRVTKSEPSVESELLRGAHRTPTTYTIRVEHSGEAPTDDVEIVDYLPAGLEYLGVAGGSGGAGNAPDEYPGSGPIPGNWGHNGERVETIEVDAAEATRLGLQGPGVYTKVTWRLAELAGGGAQQLPGTAGTPGVTEFSYAAVIPLFENTMWSGDAPDPASGAQAANLANNTGASTRHGSDDPNAPAPARVLQNTASAAGTYTGPVADDDDAHREASDRDSEIVKAVDLSVVKGIDRAASGAAFATGKLATYTLDVRVSEYVNARDVLLTDIVPNGLCPAFPSGGGPVKLTVRGASGMQDLSDDPTAWSAALGDDSCAYPSTDSTAKLTGATLVGMEFNQLTGEFTVQFSTRPIAANDEHRVSYTLRQRANYAGDKGATSSGDRLINRVTVTATTEPIAAIANDPELLEKVGGDRYPQDDSRVTRVSNASSLTKTLLKREVSLADAAEADWEETSTTPFSVGDRVWYRIQIPFARGIDTRNPILDDYLPEGVEYVSARYAWSGIIDSPDVAETNPVAYGGGAAFPNALIPEPNRTPNADPRQLTWNFGKHLGSGGGDRFMPLDSSVTVFVEGRITAQSASASDVDSPANHAKYQQVNVDGEIQFHRKSAVGDLDWGAGLVKGIKSNSHDGGVQNRGFGAGAKNETVAQGDRVTYRLDVTAPQNTTTDYLVWDVLPAGIRAADIDATSYAASLYSDGTETPIAATGFTARAYDPGELPAGSPAPKLTDRSIVIWKVSAEIAGSTASTSDAAGAVRGFTLGYTLTVPQDGDGIDGGPAAQLTQRYENTAGIVSYGVPNNLVSDTTTVVPQRPNGGQQLTDRRPASDEFGFDDAGTFDSAEIRVPGAAVEKKVVGTEITPIADAANTSRNSGTTASRPDDAVVPGERVTFEYQVTIPAHTSVAGATLSDGGLLAAGARQIPYEYQAGSAQFFGPDGAEFGAACASPSGENGFRCAEQAGSGASARFGVLTFPEMYHNGSAESKTFRARITVLVPKSAGLPSGATGLVNTAAFTHGAPAGGTPVRVEARATTTHLNPSPTLAKAIVGSAVVKPGEDASYRITAGNAAGRPALYDAVVYDCVPRGIEIVAGSLNPSVGTAEVKAGESCAVQSGTIVQGTGTGTLIEWKVGRLNAAATATLTYRGTVDPAAAGGASYQNTAAITGFSLPATSGGEDARDRRASYTLARSATVSVAEATIAKRVDKPSAPIGETVRYTLTASLPDGPNFYDLRLTDRLPAGVEFVGHVGSDVDWGGLTAPTVVSGAATGSVASGQQLTWTLDPKDVRAHDAPRSITVTFDARITNAVTAASVTNTGRLSWTKVPGDESTRVPEKSHTVTTTIQHPRLAIAKQVDGVASVQTAPGAPLNYTLRVTNSGTSSAHAATVVDRVPAGLTVDPNTISHSGELSGDGRTITWTGLPSVATGASNALVLSYSGAFASAAELDPAANNRGVGAWLVNTAAITKYSSFDGAGGREYVPGANGVPAASSQAQAAPLYPRITLNKEVVGSDLAHVGEPTTWRLTARNTGAGPAQSLTMTDQLPPHWSYEPNSARLVLNGVDQGAIEPTVEPGGKLVWKLSDDDVLLAGTGAAGTAAGGSAVITFRAIPGADAAKDASGALVATHTNTLSGSASDHAGDSVARFVGPDASATAKLESADLGVVKSRIGGADAPRMLAGTEGAAWSIVVTNHGPHRAEGPITVEDTTQALPAGIIVTSASGTGWDCGTPVRGADGTTKLSCARVSADEALASGASFPEIRVFVKIASTQPAVSVSNTAEVKPGRTVDLNPVNNRSQATLETGTAADLAIAKTVTTAEPTAGEPITWRIAPRNEGPSNSVSTTDAPVTITDTVPAGIENVTFFDATGTWTATPPAGGWNAGDTITWAHSGSSLPPGALPEILLTGTIQASWTGGAIANTAKITPGMTPDPHPENNSSTVTVTPGDSTALGLAKTRVVQRDGSWVPAGPDDRFAWGEAVTYRLTVTNHGPADARDVRIVDETPAGLNYAESSGERGTWVRSAGGSNDAGQSNATWDTFRLDGTLRVGAEASASILVTYSTDPSRPATAGAVNWAEATAENAPEPVRDSAAVDSRRVADLGITKSHVGDATAGSTIDYTIVVTNHGPSVADGEIVVTDDLPSGFSYVPGSTTMLDAEGASTAPEPAIDGQAVRWSALADGKTLAPGKKITVTFTAAVAAGLGPQQGLVNRATVSQEGDPADPDRSTDPNPANDVAKDPTNVLTRADVTITKTALGAEDSWIAGGEVSYELTVRNAGPSEVPGDVRDVLPAGLTLVSMDGGSAWECERPAPGATEGSCGFIGNEGRFPVGEPLTITVVAKIDSSVPQGTKLENTATVRWTDSTGGEGQTPKEHTDREAITVTAEADLELRKTVTAPEDGAAATAGETATYRLDVKNRGLSDAVGPITVVDELPEGASFDPTVWDGSGGWTFELSEDRPGTVEFTLDRGLANGESAPPISVGVRLDQGIAAGATLVNRAEVSSPTTDPNPENNADEASLDIVRATDLSITKTHDPAKVRVGDELPFILLVANAGPSAASGIVVTDTVPKGLTVLTELGDAGDGWTVTAIEPGAGDAAGTTVVTATREPEFELAAGEQAPALQLLTRVEAAAYPSVTNVASVAGAEPDTDSSNDEARDEVSVPPLVTLVTEKTAIGEFQVGKTGSYRITVENRGPTADPGPIRVTDVLPTGLSHVASSVTGVPGASVSVTGNTVTWTLAQGLAVGERAELSLEVRVSQAAYPRVANTVTVSSAAEQTPDAVLADTAESPVAAADPLAVTGADWWALGMLAALLLVLGGVGLILLRRRGTPVN